MGAPQERVPQERGAVYWHGVFPDLAKTGRVVARGTIRHEVLWDGDTEPTLVAVTALRLVSQAARCCAYCISLLQAAAGGQGGGDDPAVYADVDGQAPDEMDRVSP